jgi:zinc transport system permease protein
MFEDFMIRAVLSGVALSLVSGPVGCFILWKKLAYFGDTLAHSALLGVALAFFLHIDAIAGVFAIAVLVSILLIALRRILIFSGDAALGILSHSALAFGLIAISITASGKVHLNSLLFGDILAVSSNDVWVSIGVATIILAVLLWQWHSLIAHTVSSDIARVERIGSAGSELLFMVLCSGLVAIAMKITGVLLISALLILPAAIARIFARSPEMMAALAALFGVASIIGGLLMSLEYDLPSGPSIIAASASYFVAALVISRLLRSFWARGQS